MKCFSVELSSVRILRGAVGSILMDDTFTIPMEPASTCLQIARHMTAVLDENTASFANWLYQSLIKSFGSIYVKGES